MNMQAEKDEYYVVAHWCDNSATLIGLYTRTERSSRSCIAWQEDGNFDAKYHVCKYDRRRRDFVCIDTQVPYCVEQGPFTDEAWSDFNAELAK